MQRPIDFQTPLQQDAATHDTAERATEAAYWRGSVASRACSRHEQKALGQFMTPPPIARFMADGMLRNRDWRQRTVRLLDPAAGSGVLAAAMVEAALAMPARPSGIELLMFEIDPRMQRLLETTARELALQCDRLGVEFHWQAREGDFLLSDLALRGEPAVDAVIANPPYFKLPGSDPRVKLHARSVHGQPNIYGLFMGSCASLVRSGGAYCFITPRSWTNGAYFRALRICLHEQVSIDGLHLFDSRVAHFRDDAVLQEALITWATAGIVQGPVLVSTSAGAGDLDVAAPRKRPCSEIIGAAPERMVAIPPAADLTGLASSPWRLADLGLKVSTGPVVGFRAVEHLRAQPDPSTVPMLWMQHIRSMGIEWPRSHRAEYIRVSAESAWMLLPNRPMVVLRRFSPKEDQRRITAAPYVGQLPGSRIGLENHLNVVHSPDGLLSADAARGLAAYLNCGRVDEHLRRVLGSTQVNAVELRELPVPDLSSLEVIGRAIAANCSVEKSVAASLEAFETLTRHA